MFSWKKDKRKLSLICDISDCDIGIGIADLSGDFPRLLYADRKLFPIEEILDLSGLERRTMSSMKEMTRKIEEAFFATSIYELSGDSINNAQIFISSPWYSSRISTINISRDTPVLLDAHLLESAVAEEERKFEREVTSSAVGTRLGDMKAIEREILQTKLNGYKVSSPFMKKAANVDILVLNSVVSNRILTLTENTLIHNLSVRFFYVYTFPHAAFRVVKLLYPHESDFLMAHVTGEETHLVFVRDGVISAISNIPRGRNSVIRRLMNEVSVDYEIAISYLRSQQSGRLGEKMRNKVKNAIGEELKSWNDSLISSIEVAEYAVAGKKIFLSVSDDVYRFFDATLKNITADERFVVPLADNLVKNNVSYGRHVSPDHKLSVLSLFAKWHGGYHLQ